MSTRIRVEPTSSLLMWRKSFLEKLSFIVPEKPNNPNKLCLENGNKKLGKKGKFYKSMYVWNLPSVVTCPGASSWCLKNCYNADMREDIFPVKKWAGNWWLYLNNPKILMKNIINQLNNTRKPCAVRIHSSGDFFSTDYIEFWINIVEQNKQIKFWSYTRSWIINDFKHSLEKLHSKSNIELYASWDSTMIEHPPTHWRKSYVFYNENDANVFYRSNLNTFICPEQIGIAKNCASCNFCMKKINKDILFYFH